MQRKRIFAGTVLLFALFFMALCCMVIFTGYSLLVNHIVFILQKPAIKGLIIHRALTAQKYRWIQYLCGAGLLLIPATAAVLIRKADQVIAAIGIAGSSFVSGYRSVVQVLRRNSAMQNIPVVVTVIIILIKCLYYIHAWELQYDEMWCYNYLTARPFYVTFFAYNNYPLYELTTHIFKLLPFSMKTNLRLPVLIAGILSCMLLYACVRTYCKSHPAALGALLVYAFMPVTTIYMLYARGVIFESFFAIAAVFSLLFWLQSGNRKYIIIFSAANAAGMYAMPTHLYFWALLFIPALVVCLLHHRQLLNTFLLANGFTLLLSFLLYCPVILGSGLSFVTQAVAPYYSYSQILPNIPAFTASYSTYFTGFPGGMVFIVVVTAVHLLYKKEGSNRVLLPLVLMLCLFPLTVYVIQRMVVPYRASGFVALALPFIFAVTIQRLESVMSEGILYALILLTGTGLFTVSHNHHDLNWSRQRDKEAVKLCSLLMSNQVRNLYDSSSGSGFFYFYPAIEYYYSLSHKDIGFSVAASNSIRFKPFLLQDKYDCIIYRINTGGAGLPGGYKEMYADTVLNYKVLIRK